MRQRKCTTNALAAHRRKKPNLSTLTCFHLNRHWNKIGDDALGKHIKDVRPGGAGAYDCTQLSAADKLVNAQNYAFLGAVSP